jgi:hypothetical protein
MESNHVILDLVKTSRNLLREFSQVLQVNITTAAHGSST